MSLFGGHKVAQSKTTNPLTALRVTRSVLGAVIPIVFGQQRVSPILIWYGDWQAIAVVSKQASGGKGGGGNSNNSTTYDYKAAVVAALCAGQIVGIQNVWDSNGKLTSQNITENFTVPGGGGTVTPTHASNFYFDHGVGRQDPYSVVANDYGSPGPVTLSGNYNTPMTKVGSLTGGGQYTLNPATGVYTFHAADAGKQVSISYAYTIPDTQGSGQPVQTLAFTLFTGAQGQSPWSYLTSTHAGQDLGYTGIAYIADSTMDLPSGSMPNFNYEVLGLNIFGSGFTDCNPKDCINTLLTDPLIGIGFPVGNIGSLTLASNYWIANSFFISPLLDSQRATRDIIQEWLDASNVAAFWSEGLLKFVPYGDTTVVGNGSVYTPPTAPIVDLTDDDFIGDKQNDPVSITRTSYLDAFNSVHVEWMNRSNSYNPEIVEEKDQNAIELYGLRADTSSYSYHFITTLPAAQFSANARLKRNVYIRKTYKFVIGWRYSYLEPMDLVTLTDSVLGLSKTPVRIIGIEEGEDSSLTITAEEFPWGTATPTLYPKQGTSNSTADILADPGNVNAPLLFEPTARLSSESGYEIWMAVCGSGAQYGGCEVWISSDNASYKRVGRINGSARMGFATSTLGNVADPDTTSTLGVDLTESLGVLSSGTQADCDSWRTACIIDNEFISYQTATLTAPNKYNLTTRLRRGAFATTPAAHAINAPFARLDESIFVYNYDPSLIGTTVYFKFCAFNKAGVRTQSLSTVTAYSIVPTGKAVDEQNGVPIGKAYGKNLLSNPSFEFNNVGTPINIPLTIGAPCSDGWFVWQLDNPNYQQVALNNGTGLSGNPARSGKQCVYINAAVNGASIPTGVIDYGTRVITFYKIPVRVGDIIRVSGYLQWAASSVLPVGVTVLQRIGLLIYDATDTFIGEVFYDQTSNNAVFTQQQASLQIPATMSGKVPSYARAQVCGFVQNNSGSTWNVAGIFAELQFDDLMLVLQNTSFDLTPINTAGTPTTTNLCTQSGTTTTINVAASTYQYGDGQVSYSSGSVNPGAYGTFYVYADDPTYSGGAVTYLTTTNASDISGNNGRVYFGKITTSAGGGGASGASGGTGGGKYNGL